MGLDMFLMYRDKRTNRCRKYNEVEMGYWRKANQIHNWFINNCNGGIEENCQPVKLEDDKLNELLSICNVIVDKAKVEGFTLDESCSATIIKEEKQGLSEELQKYCKEVLPTQEGFFFGDTEYGYWYLRDVKSTIEIINRALAFKKCKEDDKSKSGYVKELVYVAWW